MVKCQDQVKVDSQELRQLLENAVTADKDYRAVHNKQTDKQINDCEV